MKRGMTGGAHRGPVAATRQRRTIRFVQVLLVVLSGCFLLFGAYAWTARTVGQAVVLIALGIVAIGTAWALSDGPSVRVPTPARLDELATRAEATAIERARN